MKSYEIARLFERMADVLELKGENLFRIRAYRRAAQNLETTTLVTLGDVRGDLHCHTSATDGHHSIEALVTSAAARGYAYVGVTDHSRATRVAGGLTIDELRAHVRRIRAVARKHPEITVLAGSECDILADGRLDYPDSVLAEFDLVIAAVHTRFKQSKRVRTYSQLALVWMVESAKSELTPEQRTKLAASDALAPALDPPPTESGVPGKPSSRGRSTRASASITHTFRAARSRGCRDRPRNPHVRRASSTATCARLSTSGSRATCRR